MVNQTDARVITLKDLWSILVRRLWIMAAAAVVCVLGTFLVAKLTYTPQYASTATLYVLRQDGEGTTAGADSDFSLALKVINDCTYLLKSHAVVDQVIADEGLDMSYDDLYDAISTANPTNTRILEVTVEADTPEQAKAIVDRLCQIGQEKITEAMGFRQVNFYEHGTLETEPCNRTSWLLYAIIGVSVMVAVYVGFLIAFLVDDRLRDEEDIQHYLGLSVLADIPNIDGSDRKRDYYRSYRAYRAETHVSNGKGKK